MKTPVRIDIVSDVMCPWCVVGFKGLSKALEALGDKVEAEIHWQPFELNPQTPEGGVHLQQHLMQKYQMTEADSNANRERITQVGAALGFTFNFTPDMSMYNTLNAHQLLHWANGTGKQTALKEALFEAYFGNNTDVSDINELVKIAEVVGLDGSEARAVLTEQRFAHVVRATEQQWQEAGIHSVPAVVLDEQYLISGGQPPEAYVQAFTQIIQQKTA